MRGYPRPAADLFGRLAASSAATNNKPAHDGPVFLHRLRVTPTAAVYGVLCFYGIRILARHYDGVAARRRPPGGISGRLYAAGLEGPRASGVIRPDPFMTHPDPWETHFLALFYRVRGDEKIRPAPSKNSKVAKVARPKVAGPPKSRGPKSRIVA